MAKSSKQLRIEINCQILRLNIERIKLSQTKAEYKTAFDSIQECVKKLKEIIKT